jgi:hypothetical protein
MNAFEKARLALRKYILENREQVLKDLEEMRSKSSSVDIYDYIDSVSEYQGFQ